MLFQFYMISILTIPKPRSKQYVVWEHLLKSAVAFTGTFALLFFGPLFLAPRSRHLSSQDEVPPSISFLEYMLEHPMVQIGICIVVVIIYNVRIFLSNNQRTAVIFIGLQDDQIEIRTSDRYFRGEQKLQIPLEQFGFQIVAKADDSGDGSSEVHFIQTSSNKILGKIQTSHAIWNAHIPTIREALKALEALGVQKLKTRRRSSGLFAALFN